jgi:hypothetical protein
MRKRHRIAHMDKPQIGLGLGLGLGFGRGGAVCTVSRRAQDHRSGWFWDKLLDAIEHFDEQHGALAGPPLWGSVECRKSVQLLIVAAWAAGVFLWM